MRRKRRPEKRAASNTSTPVVTPIALFGRKFPHLFSETSRRSLRVVPKMEEIISVLEAAVWIRNFCCWNLRQVSAGQELPFWVENCPGPGVDVASAPHFFFGEKFLSHLLGKQTERQSWQETYSDPSLFHFEISLFDSTSSLVWTKHETNIRAVCRTVRRREIVHDSRNTEVVQELGCLR